MAWNEPELLDLHDRLMDLLELWNFTETPDVDPTKQPRRARPQVLRFAVLLRKRSGGTSTDHGDRYMHLPT